MSPPIELAAPGSGLETRERAPDGTPESRARGIGSRIWIAAAFLLCLGVLWLQVRHIAETLPYPLHVDEPFVARPAARMLATGSLHPEQFNYPSFPKYLAAVGMAGGFLSGAGRREIQDVRAIGNVGFPYYDSPGVVRAARQLFALLSVLTLAACAAVAWQVSRTPAAVLLAPLLLAASPLYFFHSWTYLNVDIVGACFVTLTLVACLAGIERPSIAGSAVLPGALAGLATGSKYNLALVILPVLLSIAITPNFSRRASGFFAALAAMVVSFLAVVPHSVLEIPAFLNGVAAMAYHYASGHPGYSAEPGLPQAVYYARHFVGEFGIVGVVLALVGGFATIVKDWRRAVVLLGFPLALMALLIGQRVHFARNALSLHPVVAMFAAVGIVSVHVWATGLSTRRGWISGRAARASSLVVGLVLVVAAIPVRHVIDPLRDRTDSRTRAQAWIRDHLSREWSVVVPSELGVDTRDLAAAGRHLVVAELRAARDPAALEQIASRVPGPAVVLVPAWGADGRFPGEELAQALNALAGRWRVLETFGTNPVLVNYTYAVPAGDPAFAVAVLREPAPSP